MMYFLFHYKFLKTFCNLAQNHKLRAGWGIIEAIGYFAIFIVEKTYGIYVTKASNIKMNNFTVNLDNTFPKNQYGGISNKEN